MSSKSSSPKGSSWVPKYKVGNIIIWTRGVYNNELKKRELKSDVLKVVGIDTKTKTYRFSYAHGTNESKLAGEMDGKTIEKESSLLTTSKTGGKRKSKKSRSKKSRRRTYRR